MPRLLSLTLACLLVACGGPAPKPASVASSSTPPLFDDFGELHRGNVNRAYLRFEAGQ